MSDSIKNIVRSEAEKLFFDNGFTLDTVKLAQKTNDGIEKIECYKSGDLYCMVTFLRHSTTSGEIKDWVLIEYAYSLHEAERWMFEDGGLIPLDIPLEQIIAELKQELIESINCTD